MKNFLIAAGAFGLGFYVSKSYYQQHYLNVANEEVAAAKVYYEDSFMQKEAAREATVEEAVKSLQEYQGDLNLETPEKPTTNEVVDYTKFYEDDVPEEGFKNNVRRVPAPSREEPIHRPPYIIPTDDFLNDTRGFDQMTLNYHSDGGVVSNEKDEKVKDAEELLGKENLTKFGELSGNQDIVYIRNEEYGKDFEVIRTIGSYAEEVLGERTS